MISADDPDFSGLAIPVDLARCDGCGQEYVVAGAGAVCPDCGPGRSTPIVALAFVTERPTSKRRRRRYGPEYVVVLVDLTGEGEFVRHLPITPAQAAAILQAPALVEPAPVPDPAACVQSPPPPPPTGVVVDEGDGGDDDVCPICWHSGGAGHATEGGVCFCGCVSGWDGWALDEVDELQEGIA